MEPPVFGFYFSLTGGLFYFRTRVKIVYKYIEKPVYIECQKPIIPEKPEFISYQIFRVQFEGKYYYCTDIENARIISENWLRYKS
ncbi:hypothetical protein [Persephonella sp.]